MVSPGWRLTYGWILSFAAESPPDHLREPKDKYGGEANGHHHEPRQCLREKAGHRASPLRIPMMSAGTRSDDEDAPETGPSHPHP